MQVKKMRILTSTIAPISALAISGCFVATCIAKKPVNPVDNKDFTVSFDAGEGKFNSKENHSVRVYANTHFYDVEQPEVAAPNKSFAGWLDSETKKPILGKSLVNRNMKLTAAYNDRTGEYASVTFSPGSTGATLHGNVNIAVNKGYYFFMINRPCVKLTGKVFKGWVYANGPLQGEDVKENDVIKQDITLVPSFDQGVVMTWNGSGATKIRGSETTTVKAGCLFKSVNQPVYKKEGNIFVGWYKDSEFSQPWEESSVVTTNSVAYAKWSPESTTECIINYVQKPNTEVVPIFAPASTQLVARDSTHWAEVFKPQVSTASGDYKVGGWEYSLNGKTDWQEIPNDMQFTTESIYIAPKMVPLVENIYISGPEEVVTQSSANYKAYIIGAQTQTVTWDVYDEKPTPSQPHPAASTIATINNKTGELTVGFVPNEGRKIYIQATSTIKEDEEYITSEPLEVEILMPYVNSDLIWYYEETANDSNWYSADAFDLANKESEYFSAKSLKTGEITSIDKSNPFENKLFIGRNRDLLPNDFLCKFTGFNGEIDFAETYSSTHTLINSKNNVKVIGDSFLEGCINFNKQIQISNNISKIGSNFLYGCEHFNNGSTSDDQPLDLSLSSAKTIGNNFLGCCIRFNQQLYLPSKLETIGESFMINCMKYDKTLHLLSSINEIQPFFMYNCCDFTGTIVVDCIYFSKTFKGNQQQICAANETYTDPDTGEIIESKIYSEGYKVAGAFANDFLKKFGNKSDSELGIYRKSVTTTDMHQISVNTTLTSVSATSNKSVIDASSSFDLIIENDRTDNISDATISFVVGNQKFYETISDIPTGETRISYNKQSINELLINHGLTEMSFDDSISITINRIGSYNVKNNRLYKMDENDQYQIVSDTDLAALAGKFLIKNTYNEYALSTQTLLEYIDSCAFGSSIDLTLISGEYYIGNYKLPEGQTTKKLTLHGIEDSNKNKAEFRIVSERICPTSNLNANGLEFDIYNIKLLGILQNNTSNDWLNNCMISSKLHATNCYLEGAFTLHNTDASFTNCVFDSRMVAFGGQSQYAIFNYGSQNAVFENCDFYSCGKSFKLYALNMIGHDATSILANCHFIYDTTQVVGTIPGCKCPLDIDAQQLSTDTFYVTLAGCTMSNYPSSITTLYNVKGADHCVITVK